MRALVGSESDATHAQLQNVSVKAVMGAAQHAHSAQYQVDALINIHKHHHSNTLLDTANTYVQNQFG
jgi:UDP-2,3-diacylglucosamine pyrophosphatase LpxH